MEIRGTCREMNYNRINDGIIDRKIDKVRLQNNKVLLLFYYFILKRYTVN